MYSITHIYTKTRIDSRFNMGTQLIAYTIQDPIQPDDLPNGTQSLMMKELKANGTLPWY